MRVPTALEPLMDMGIIEEVVRPLMSGKEAQVYIVVAGGQERVAKVYKDSTLRSFQKRTDYTDGRNVRNSRDRRAMNKRTRHGRAEDEAAWRNAEVDVIYRLRDAGVRVPAPYNFMEGVLVMDLVIDEDELPAPRLGDLTFSPEVAREVYDQLIQEVVRMLCAGVVHGDLSDFNVLMGAEGPVVIDFPQAVDPVSSSTARKLLIRDVDNLHRFLSRSVPHANAPYAQEMWDLFERNELTPETVLRGQYRDRRRKADTKGVLKLVGDAKRDADRRTEASRPARARGRRGRKDQRKDKRGFEPQVEVLVRSGDGRTRLLHAAAPAAPAPEPANPAKKRRRSRGRKPAGGGPVKDPNPQAAAGSGSEAPAKKRRRRRRRAPRGAGPSTGTGEASS
ncbi:MAG: PA4780 family RIO1-like protein kinase [Nannocystales bacterium]